MKKLLTVRNLLLCAALLLGVLVLVFSFLTNVKCYDSDGTLNSQLFNVVWGSKKQEAYMGSVTVSLDETYKALVLPLVGAVLAVVGGLVACAASFLVKNEKTRKLVILVAALLMVVGAVFAFLTTLNMFNVMAQKTYDSLPAAMQEHTSVKEIKEQMKEAGGSMKAPLAIVSGILALVGGLSAAASKFVPEK